MRTTEPVAKNPSSVSPGGTVKTERLPTFNASGRSSGALSVTRRISNPSRRARETASAVSGCLARAENTSTTVPVGIGPD